MGAEMVSLDVTNETARSGAVNTNSEPDGRPVSARRPALVDSTTPAHSRNIPTPTTGFIASVAVGTDVFALFVDDKGVILSSVTDEDSPSLQFDTDHLPAIAEMFERALATLKGRQRCTG